MIPQLEKVLEIQARYPNMILGGSLGLIVQGIKIEERQHDVDLNTNQIQNLEGETDNKEVLCSSDFQKTSIVDGIKIQQAFLKEIDTFRMVNYEGKEFKTLPVENILYYKLKYAIYKKVDKHRKDLFNMLGIEYYPIPEAKKDVISNTSNDLFW